jgi:hypothetical protein
MRKILTALSVGIVLTGIFAASAPNASATTGHEHRGPIACIANGHSCTHDDNCCSNNCVNRTCK